LERKKVDVVEAYQQGYCSGMLSTLFVMGRRLPDKSCFEAPSTSNVGQAMQIVVSFLEARPARLKEPFVDLATFRRKIGNAAFAI
jgi:hypothetical protein